MAWEEDKIPIATENLEMAQHYETQFGFNSLAYVSVKGPFENLWKQFIHTDGDNFGTLGAILKFYRWNGTMFIYFFVQMVVIVKILLKQLT